MAPDFRRALARPLAALSRRRTDGAAPDGQDSAAPRRRPSLRLVALGTALLVAAGGSVAVASAHKTVTLDVDGRLTEVGTFAGSVDGLLDEVDLDLGERDVVAPGGDTALREGDEVVVRHARQVTVLADGTESRVWTTALSADEVLASLASRGSDVRLLASRSASTGRTDLGVHLDLDGPVTVVVDGESHEVEDGSIGLPAVLEELALEVGSLDRVSVHLPEGETSGRVTVTIQRVAAEELTTTHEVPFESVQEQTDDLYKGQSEVRTAGIAGVRTLVERVVLVDGQEESRMVLSDAVTQQPVTEVVAVGTKARPAPRPAAPAASGAASTVSGDVWGALAQCESGGNPTIVSSNGLYHGLYQFSVSTWQSVGGAGLPSQASPAEQTERAKILQARSGWGQWPACSRKLGLR